MLIRDEPQAAREPSDQGFTLFPAIDLRGGRCVRLRQGEAGDETVYSDDPLAVALEFSRAGAEWLHVVDLDAAFGTGSQRALIGRIAAEAPLRVQTGGGLRSEEDLAGALAAGAERVVIGTAAVEDPPLVRRALERWGPERIVVGLDARGRVPAVRGWTAASGRDLFELAASLVEMGVRTVIHTDIERDGMLAGPNLELSAALAAASGARVVVSGGVGELAHLEAAAWLARGGAGLDGAILGKALYEGRVDLAQALQRVKE
jgi:phosphoribosylformimino-5-aminoimidazole carboxamide ribotide isomerase